MQRGKKSYSICHTPYEEEVQKSKLETPETMSTKSAEIQKKILRPSSSQ